MYVPQHFALATDDAVGLAAEIGVGHLVTSHDGGLDSTFVPFIVERRGDTLVARAHLAAANPQRHAVAAGATALLIVHGPDAYVSPGHYPSKREHGRVVPTWNYAVVHLHGTLRLVDDRDALLSTVSDLTDRHEASTADPWKVTDAPDEFIDGQLKAIVGLELLVSRVDGKAKLSQNRPEPDHDAVRTAFLAGDPRQREVGEMMR